MLRVIRQDALERIEYLNVKIERAGNLKEIAGVRGYSFYVTVGAMKKEIEEIRAGGAIQRETWGNYWVRRCWELTQELFILEKGEDTEYPLDSVNFEIYKNYKIRELENARVALSRCEVNVEVGVSVRQTVNILV